MTRTKGMDPKGKEVLSTQVLYLGTHEEACNARLKTLAKEHFVERMWQKDPTLWKGDAKSQDQIRGSLGWLDVVPTMALHTDDIRRFAAESLLSGLKHGALMGMGGSKRHRWHAHHGPRHH
jgi:transaldolase/glucose-6-phosphate isomerase